MHVSVFILTNQVAMAQFFKSQC
uniref:Uncharacterized protein n=1 Tax=Arundo donax TaxID=35708 RepID=A0A0A9F2V2_ARUDO